MKHFKLGRVYITNFRSYSNATVELSQSQGLKLFSGQNIPEPALGANGVGKSTFWEAIFWCFYGTGVQEGEKTSSMISWNQKQAEVLVELFVNDQPHTVYRSGPPTKAELDGEAATQSQLDMFLGLTEDQFLHSVFFGQGIPLFPDLPIPKRGELLDSVLNLNVWNKATECAKSKITLLEKEIADKKIQLSHLEGQLSQLSSEEDLKIMVAAWNEQNERDKLAINLSIKEWDEQKEKKIDEIKQQIDEWKSQKRQTLESFLEQLDSMERERGNTEAVLLGMPDVDISIFQNSVKELEKELNLKMQKYSEINAQRVVSIEPRNFWLKNNNCPTCLQPITSEEKEKHLAEIDQKEQELVNSLSQLDDALENLKKEVEEKRAILSTAQINIAKTEELKSSYRRDIERLDKQIKFLIKSIEITGEELEKDYHPYSKQLTRTLVEANPYKSNLQKLQKLVNPYVDLLARNALVRADLKKSIDSQNEEIKKIESTIISTEYWKHGFKRIRLYFIEQILAVLEVDIRSALSSRGLDKWTVKLTTEAETKSGTTKLGVQIQVKSPKAEAIWSSWSGGESQRLRLAIASGVASLIQRAAGVFYGWETWDEPTSWLSNEGIEDLLQSLEYRAEALKKSIWVIDHRALQFAGFTEIWLVTKKEEGSSISLMSEVS